MSISTLMVASRRPIVPGVKDTVKVVEPPLAGTGDVGWLVTVKSKA